MSDTTTKTTRQDAQEDKRREALRQASEREVVLPVQGMTCAACVGRIERKVSKVAGVRAASVNLASERATVRGG